MGGGVNSTVSKENLNDPDVSAIFEQMSSKAMTECVGGDFLSQSRAQPNLSASRIESPSRQMLSCDPGGEQVLLADCFPFLAGEWLDMRGAPIEPQNTEQSWESSV